MLAFLGKIWYNIHLLNGGKMPVNLLNEKDLNAYLTDVVYQGQENHLFADANSRGHFESPDYVTQNKDAITKAILLQWVKHRLRAFLTDKENMPFLQPVSLRAGLPTWAEKCLSEGKQIFEFNALLMSQSLKNDIVSVRDFLYSAAEKYVEKTALTARETKTAPKIRFDYLKTNNEFDSFEKALLQSQKWHNLMTERALQKAKNKQLYEKSLSGTQLVMELPDGMKVYRLMTAQALDFESEYMGHCVGKGAYDANVVNGSVQIYSVRDQDGQPHATLEVRHDEVYQCKGKGNRTPVQKYIPAIQAFIESRNFEIVGDMKNVGLIKQDGKYYSVWDLPKRGFELKGNLDLSDMDLTELPDLSNIIVDGNFECRNNKLVSLKGAPLHVSGGFDCSHNQLTDLNGAPKYIAGSLDCSHNQLTTLKGCPERLGGSLYCINNQLMDLQGAPEHIEGSFDCSNNQLTTLKGAPQGAIRGEFDCQQNKLTSLEGAPQKVSGSFNCKENDLTTLKGAPQKVGGSFFCSFNKLVSLEGAPQEIGGAFDCSENQLTTLKGAPQNLGDGFYCNKNKLISLEGAPQKVSGTFDCHDNNLTTLEGGPNTVGRNFKCNKNQLTTLKGAPQIVTENFNCAINRLTSLENAPKTIAGKFICFRNQLTDLKGGPQCVGDNFDCTENPLLSLEGAPEKLGRTFICCLTAKKGIYVPAYVANYVRVQGVERHLLLKMIQKSKEANQAPLKSIASQIKDLFSFKR